MIMLRKIFLWLCILLILFSSIAVSGGITNSGKDVSVDITKKLTEEGFKVEEDSAVKVCEKNCGLDSKAISGITGSGLGSVVIKARKNEKGNYIVEQISGIAEKETDVEILGKRFHLQKGDKLEYGYEKGKENIKVNVAENNAAGKEGKSCFEYSETKICGGFSARFKDDIVSSLEIDKNAVFVYKNKKGDALNLAAKNGFYVSYDESCGNRADCARILLDKITLSGEVSATGKGFRYVGQRNARSVIDFDEKKGILVESGSARISGIDANEKETGYALDFENGILAGFKKLEGDFPDMHVGWDIALKGRKINYFLDSENDKAIWGRGIEPKGIEGDDYIIFGELGNKGGQEYFSSKRGSLLRNRINKLDNDIAAIEFAKEHGIGQRDIIALEKRRGEKAEEIREAYDEMEEVNEGARAILSQLPGNELNSLRRGTYTAYMDSRDSGNDNGMGYDYEILAETQAESNLRKKGMSQAFLGVEAFSIKYGDAESRETGSGEDYLGDKMNLLRAIEDYVGLEKMTGAEKTYYLEEKYRTLGLLSSKELGRIGERLDMTQLLYDSYPYFNAQNEEKRTLALDESDPNNPRLVEVEGRSERLRKFLSDVEDRKKELDEIEREMNLHKWNADIIMKNSLLEGESQEEYTLRKSLALRVAALGADNAYDNMDKLFPEQTAYQQLKAELGSIFMPSGLDLAVGFVGGSKGVRLLKEASGLRKSGRGAAFAGRALAEEELELNMAAYIKSLGRDTGRYIKQAMPIESQAREVKQAALIMPISTNIRDKSTGAFKLFVTESGTPYATFGEGKGIYRIGEDNNLIQVESVVDSRGVVNYLKDKDVLEKGDRFYSVSKGRYIQSTPVKYIFESDSPKAIVDRLNSMGRGDVVDIYNHFDNDVIRIYGPDSGNLGMKTLGSRPTVYFTEEGVYYNSRDGITYASHRQGEEISPIIGSVRADFDRETFIEIRSKSPGYLNKVSTRTVRVGDRLVRDSKKVSGAAITGKVKRVVSGSEESIARYLESTGRQDLIESFGLKSAEEVGDISEKLLAKRLAEVEEKASEWEKLIEGLAELSPATLKKTLEETGLNTATMDGIMEKL